MNSQMLVTYGFALLLPLLYLSYRIRFSKPKQAPTPAESHTKPLKPIMQAPNADLLPPKDDSYTVEELAKYDGSDSSKPILVAIKGDIFDVTKKSDVYGPGRSYHIFAGKDGSRGLGMSSLKTEHAVSDYTTLTESEMKVLDEWHSFFSKRYNIVGKVVGSSPTANM
ncbi:cytochrome b5-like heme/steroid binding domain-containing protein [Ephemerocybe angulata]|uniref:Cytochrome b5-like heme/steroid binding domain-containing protein n=1 Tax=Ephemerocybe angulata TaxID=980116 RepID=A0A8H6I0F7_9AGAR|nr:cytochrome b5-like heme/steroid binding domain-containing protein [Tulosesus angulatus]